MYLTVEYSVKTSSKRHSGAFFCCARSSLSAINAHRDALSSCTCSSDPGLLHDCSFNYFVARFEMNFRFIVKEEPQASNGEDE